ncbi:hypothetical protein [Neisseria arctica]|uniref:hypothetical protein n=1 Tax=Neisseria arctica TaxID=1470200 RepID=UPI00069998AC|nr:hypothetical protein [Neisseria arctica]UOO87670.1 hypothetical protein LVJ86_05345 [Neisseria arctica]
MLSSDNNNYKDGLPAPEEKAQPDCSGSVVVVESVFYWPRCFTREKREAAINLFTKQLPNTAVDRLQEILDEISGQKKAISSPMGLLATLVNLEKQGFLECLVAPTVKARRYENLKRQEAEQLRLRELTQQGDSDKTAEPGSEKARFKGLLAKLNKAKH